MKRKTDAERAIRTIATREGETLESVRTQMQLAMLAGLRSEDAAIQGKWKSIPCKGDIPTPEELLGYLATHFDSDILPSR